MTPHKHPNNNAMLGAPEGVPDEECSALPITRVQFANDTPAVVSYWTPSEAERGLIAQGAAVRLCVWGTTHAPLHVGVDGDGLMP
jgi:hypothetical protein